MLNILAFIDPSAFAFDGKISIGAIFNAIVILVGFVASWYKMQSKTENYEKELGETTALAKETSRQVQLLSLTVERLSTLSEVNEKKWDRAVK